MVTGGLGFLGGSITDALLEKGAEVVIVDKNKKSKEPKDRKDMTIFINDANKTKMDALKKEHFDLIFHFGSPCSNLQFMKNPHVLDETVSGTLNVFEMAKAVGAKVIYPSSCTVYAGELPQSESIVLPKPTTLYSVGKLACENMAYYYKKVFGVKSTGLRIFVAYGDREEYKGNLASAVTQFLMSIEKGKQPIIWGDGTQFRDAIYVRDATSLIMRVALDDNSPMAINVGTGNAITFNEIVSMINKQLGKNIKPKYVPKPNWYIGNNKADMTLAKRLYNFKPTNLNEGLKQYILYRQEKGLLV